MSKRRMCLPEWTEMMAAEPSFAAWDDSDFRLAMYNRWGRMDAETVEREVERWARLRTPGEGESK